MIRILLVQAVLVCWTSLHAQVLEVTNAPPITPQNLITNIFLGDGVQVLNVNYEGPGAAVGFFKNGQTAVSMERGLVMTTGRAVTQGLNLGVAETGTQQASVDNMSNVMDVDMDAIAGGVPIHNVARYTITFIPIADTLRFRYAFASEEYPEFVCSEFNDIFGFFISGPGINGPYQNNAINIARVPGTNLPVTINNVNPGVVGAAGELDNCLPPRGSLAYGALYNDNDGSNVFPVYDGITDVFVAEAIVQPCQVYTIKLVICDVSDQVYDSGVFLEAKSFGTGSLDVDVATVSLDGSVAEGCSSANITFSLPNPVESDYPIDFQLLGTAINGVDYEQIPSNLFIPAGDSSVSINVQAIEDGITEGDELLMIDVQRDLCNRDTVFIVVRDNPLTKPDLGNDPTICPDTPVALDGTIPVVLPPLPTFTNSNNLTINPINTPIFSNIQVTGVIPNELSPDILRSICIDSLSHPWIDDLDAYLITPGGQFIELTTDNGGNGGNGLGPDFYRRTCFTPDATTRINFPGPLAPPSAVPFTGNWLPEGEWSDIWGGPVNGQWRLQLIDDTNS
nr:choice-of-anchor L domain-containing protein [Saprospiraceae bacterium]